MANDVKKYSIYLIAIVAIVAVVGIVVMTTNFGEFGEFSEFSGTTKESAPVSDGNELKLDLTGKATNMATYWACMKTDGCNDLFKQYTQTKDPSIRAKYVECSKNCKLKADQPQQAYCTDSDGDDIYTKGTVVSNYYPEGKEDVCQTFDNDLTQLLEGVCDGTKYKINYINCESGCNNGICVKTCAQGPTGKGKCVKDQWNWWQYKKEYQNADCTTYLSDTDVKGCGYADNSCQDDVGCCKNDAIITECQGNIIYNQTKNSCTGELKETYFDCTTIKEWTNGQPKVCYFTPQNNFATCSADCEEGDIIYKCDYDWKTKTYKYKQATCKVNPYLHYWETWSSNIYEPTCPSGATCYNPEAKCA